MQQPARPRLSAALLALGLGCAGGGDAPAPRPSPAPAAAAWRLAGRAELGGPPGALPFAGARAALERCGNARPCAVELWRADGGTGELVLLRAGTRLHRLHGGVPAGSPWPARWSRLDGALATCLPDPLAVPPAGDPGGWRQLVRAGDGWEWRVHLSGDNPCGLAGTLVLHADGPGIDPGALACGGRRWREGGLECARAHARALRRGRIAERWPSMSEEERAAAVLELARDPEGRALLERLQR